MGIHDRDYYQETERERRVSIPNAWSITTWVIVVNCAVFVLELFLTTPGPNGVDPLFKYGHFSTEKVLWAGGLQFWRFLTFQFLHAGPVHLAMNMFGLYIFGPVVEQNLGRKKFLAFYLVCGIFGGLMYLLLNAGGMLFDKMKWPLVPGLLFNDQGTPLVGASAGVFGVLMACAYIEPRSMITMVFPPISIRMRTFAYVYLAIAAINLFARGKNAGGDAAHVGGALAGYFFVRNSHLLRDFFDVFTDSRKNSKGGASGGQGRKGPKLRLVDDANSADDKELDRILRKISDQGRSSLTPKEERFLSQASDRKRSAGGE